MHRLSAVPDDFEAVIRILSEAEGGRKTPPFNGIRWDFSYAQDEASNHLYMIWPDFFSSSGDSMPTDSPLPIGVELSARMTILNDEMREQIHRARIEAGLEFYCHEGPKRVAIGRVTRITGLHDVRKSVPQSPLAPEGGHGERRQGHLQMTIQAKPSPYRWRTAVRRHLPWFLIDLGFADKGPDCERVGGTHAWYNHDDANSACYHCKVVRPGRLWEEQSQI